MSQSDNFEQKQDDPDENSEKEEKFLSPDEPGQIGTPGTQELEDDSYQELTLEEHHIVKQTIITNYYEQGVQEIGDEYETGENNNQQNDIEPEYKQKPEADQSDQELDSDDDDDDDDRDDSDNLDQKDEDDEKDDQGEKLQFEQNSNEENETDQGSEQLSPITQTPDSLFDSQSFDSQGDQEHSPNTPELQETEIVKQVVLNESKNQLVDEKEDLQEETKPRISIAQLQPLPKYLNIKSIWGNKSSIQRLIEERNQLLIDDWNRNTTIRRLEFIVKMKENENERLLKELRNFKKNAIRLDQTKTNHMKLMMSKLAKLRAEKMELQNLVGFETNWLNEDKEKEEKEQIKKINESEEDLRKKQEQEKLFEEEKNQVAERKKRFEAKQREWEKSKQELKKRIQALEIETKGLDEEDEKEDHKKQEQNLGKAKDMEVQISELQKPHNKNVTNNNNLQQDYNQQYFERNVDIMATLADVLEQIQRSGDIQIESNKKMDRRLAILGRYVRKAWKGQGNKDETEEKDDLYNKDRKTNFAREKPSPSSYAAFISGDNSLNSNDKLSGLGSLTENKKENEDPYLYGQNQKHKRVVSDLNNTYSQPKGQNEARTRKEKHKQKKGQYPQGELVRTSVFQGGRRQPTPVRRADEDEWLAQASLAAHMRNQIKVRSQSPSIQEGNKLVQSKSPSPKTQIKTIVTQLQDILTKADQSPQNSYSQKDQDVKDFQAQELITQDSEDRKEKKGEKISPLTNKQSIIHSSLSSGQQEKAPIAELRQDNHQKLKQPIKTTALFTRTHAAAVKGQVKKK
ncbi:MAG: hypothetical protein EZS28_008656 [Streblomastix strix]|uniref:Uncharacterized protein n=1 Tax=Streblomastix strix TaxID=222440 RepID=A0A5J4WNP6_9EUKA|nr:MAG: hypothetical protein EZS28_008656 [Streblomastix strix]